MEFERLYKAAKSAKKAGVPVAIVDRALNIARLEREENSDCPVPDCLVVLLEEAALPTISGRLALLDLEKVIDLRDQHFKHPDREPLWYPH